MNTVKVQRLQLLEKLKTNRAAHRDMFLDAQKGYRIDVIEGLDKMLADAREGKNIRTYLELPAPMDHTVDYDRAIGMLEMSVDDQVTIASNEFDSYVMDNWQWKGATIANNMRYLGKA